MERALALTLSVLVTMGVVAVKLLIRAGAIANQSDWHQFWAAHTTFWLLLVPFVYFTIAEVVRTRQSSAPVVALTRGLGIALLVAFGVLFTVLIFNI